LISVSCGVAELIRVVDAFRFHLAQTRELGGYLCGRSRTLDRGQGNA
jgi:hypothetical protein